LRVTPAKKIRKSWGIAKLDVEVLETFRNSGASSGKVGLMLISVWRQSTTEFWYF